MDAASVAEEKLRARERNLLVLGTWVSGVLFGLGLAEE